MSPTSEVGKTASSSNFDLISSLKIDGDISLEKYKSNRTGLTVMIAAVEGPIVDGNLCLATEAHDHDGLPHTLEHLIFLGSENYPYKGVLDLLANRCLADGTNAATYNDHTCYKMKTAGAEGFLNLLPIYLDHVLYPLLSDTGYTTEVHHINGEGENAGVVYCEMQGCENTGENLAYRELLSLLYPGKCGYKSVTGGVMLNLRESTNNLKVRDYHKSFYRPDNLCVIIAGQVKAADVFKSIQIIEDKIVSKGKLADFVRPWESLVPLLDKSVDKQIEYPCDDEKHGIVFIAWRGPKATEIEEFTAITILLDYLVDTSVSPLRMEFVERDDPYCSGVSCDPMVHSSTCFALQFSNPPIDKVDEIKNKLIEVLKNIANEEKPLDMSRMATMIHRKKINILNDMENYAEASVTDSCSVDFLYGTTSEHLNQRVNQISVIDKFAVESSRFWLDLLKKYFIDKPMVSILAKPSCKLSEKLANDEKSRINSQREQLGDEGLKQKENELQKAIEINEIEPPEDLLTCVNIPGIESIRFHPINRCCSYKKGQSEWQNIVEQFPCRFQLDDCHSMFVTMNVFLNSNKLPSDLCLYLPLFTNLIKESPILRDGTLIPFETVVTELTSDSLYCNCGVDSWEMAVLKISVEKSKYAKGVNWLRELLFATRFVTERVSVIATKLLNGFASQKRVGFRLTREILQNLAFEKHSTYWSDSLFRQEKFLKQIKAKLETKPDEVLDALEKVREFLTRPSNLTVHMMADLKSLSGDSLNEVAPEKAPSCPLVDPWKQFFMKENDESRKNPPAAIQNYQLLVPASTLGSGVIAGVGAVESAYLEQCAQLDLARDHPDVPALLVLLNYLTQTEGPMWKELRGRGLVYGYGLHFNLKEKLLYFDLFKCTHLVNAYKETKNILERYVSKSDNVFDSTLLESSRSTLVFALVNQEKSLAAVFRQSQEAYFGDYDIEFRRQLMKSVLSVSVSDLQRVGPLYLPLVFDVDKTQSVVCCHPSKVEAIVAGFKEISKEMKIIPCLEESVFADF